MLVLTAMMFKNHSRYHLVVTVVISRTGRAGGKGKGSLERLIQAAATALTAIAIGKEKDKFQNRGKKIKKISFEQNIFRSNEMYFVVTKYYFILTKYYFVQTKYGISF